MRAYGFTDTNVLLHYQFFDQIDWAKELRADDVVLVFAPVVFSELDRHKTTGSRREKKRARAVLKRLDELSVSATNVAMKPSVSLLALDAEPSDALFTQYRLSPQVNDDRLLASVIEFRAAVSGERVLIVTADSGLRVKAKSRGIDVLTPNESLELADEPDEVERELEATRRALADERSAMPELRLTFSDGETHIKGEIKCVAELDRATMQGLLKNWRKENPHVNAPPSSFTLPDGSRFSMESFAGLPGVITAEDAERRNEKIDAVFAEYEAFLRAWPEAVNALARTVPVYLVLENDGTAPADDVDVTIETDVRGRWLREFPQLPSAPVVPRARSPYDLISPRVFTRDFPDLGLSIRHPTENVDGPNISEDDPSFVQYVVRRVKHHVPCALNVAYFRFDSDGDITSFTLNVTLVAANIRKPKTQQLHIELSRAAPIPPPLPSAFEEAEED